MAYATRVAYFMPVPGEVAYDTGGVRRYPGGVCHGWRTGYGLKYRGARMQPLTRGPEADETKTM